MRFKFLLILLILLNSCEKLQPKEESARLARVGDHYLYLEEIEQLGLTINEPEDSIQIVNAYINSWLRTEAYLQHAKEELSSEQLEEITSKVDDYRESLFTAEYEKLMIENKLDTTFSTEEIQLYYDENIDEFEVKEPIYKFIALKSDKPFDNSKDIEIWINEYIEDGNDAQISEYCLYQTIRCNLDIQNWVSESDFFETFDINEKYIITKPNRLIKVNSEDDYYYLYKIIEKKSIGIYPLNYVDDDIRNILMRKREREFVEEIRDEIFEQKKSANQIEVYD